MRRVHVAWSLLLLACAREERTEVVVIVEPEPKELADSTRLAVTVVGDPGGRSVVLRDNTSADWKRGNYTIGLAPSGGVDGSRYLVEVTALRGDQPLVTARLIGGYVPQERRYVKLVLGEACVGAAMCGPDRTCFDGRCVEATVDARSFASSAAAAPASGTLARSAEPQLDGGSAASSDAAMAGDGRAPVADASSERDAATPALVDASPGSAMAGLSDGGVAPAAPRDGSLPSEAGPASESDAALLSPQDQCKLCTNPAYPCVEALGPGALGYTCLGQMAEWPMPDDPVVGAKHRPSYDTASEPDVVIDEVTGLRWQRATAIGTYTWETAKNYCASLSLSNRKWRLPSYIELVSLADYARFEPAIDAEAFPMTPAEDFWTASPKVGSASEAYYLSFEDGSGGTRESTLTARVRCVFSQPPLAGRSPANRYTVDRTADTVTDTRTGLIWRRTLLTITRSQSGREACAALGAGFRLPTVKELETLHDPARVKPAIDLLAFPNTPAAFHVSATPYVPNPELTSWGHRFGGDGADGAMLYVRCVR